MDYFTVFPNCSKTINRKITHTCYVCDDFATNKDGMTENGLILKTKSAATVFPTSSIAYKISLFCFTTMGFFTVIDFSQFTLLKLTFCMVFFFSSVCKYVDFDVIESRH